jgi:glycosyltransferase involved in cell wall biosynthesis
MIKSTIIVSPRERFSPFIASLRSLFATIMDDVPVIVVAGGAPLAICKEIDKLRKIRPFEWIHKDYFLTPNEARNIGFEKVNTEFVVFTDNDIAYELDWLEALEENAENNNADLVAPLICIGPPLRNVIHHAGGRLSKKIVKDGIQLREGHRLGGMPISDLNDISAPIINEVTEFHTVLFTSDFVSQMGGFDERLITREHVDVALRAKTLNKLVTFERKSVVTYLAKVHFEKNDLSYFLFRWNNKLAERSIDTFCETWGVSVNRADILGGFIGNHRTRAIATAYPILQKVLGFNGFRHFIAHLERKNEKKISFKRINIEDPKIPLLLMKKAINEMLLKID